MQMSKQSQISDTIIHKITVNFQTETKKFHKTGTVSMPCLFKET